MLDKGAKELLPLAPTGGNLKVGIWTDEWATAALHPVISDTNDVKVYTRNQLYTFNNIIHWLTYEIAQKFVHKFVHKKESLRTYLLTFHRLGRIQ